jgi:hypothetical protein
MLAELFASLTCHKPGLFLAINAAQADTFGAVAVQDFEGVAVENSNNGAGEVGGESATTQDARTALIRATLPITIVQTLTTASSHGYFIFLGS